MTFNEFKNNVELWAAERGIYDHSSTSAQLMKALSELGELADAIIKGDDEAIKDAVGDIAVCVINAAYLDDAGLDKASRLVAMPNEPLVKAASSTPASVVGRIATGIGEYLSGFKDEYNRQAAFTGSIVALKRLCAHKGLDLMDCCEHAWNEIKDRKGRMVSGGAFVKDEDEQKQDGGPAFPEGKGVGEAWVSEGGMTLRDYFAAKAMQGAMASDTFMSQINTTAAGAKVPPVAIMADTAYAIADVMLKERSK